MSAVDLIGPILEPGNLLILESTSPVGTTNIIESRLIASGVDLSDISIAYCPERVLPGKVMTELVHNDRVVGGINEASARRVCEFYKTFVEGRVLSTDSKTAEMCKLTENSFRDVNIAFANELSVICEREGIDVWKLIALANKHPRVNILQPGTGVGGHCIAVDPWFIVARHPKDAKIIKAARETNINKTEWVVDQVLEAANKLAKRGVESPRVACLGLSFKPDIDDLRESPASEVVTKLMEHNLDVLAVEPHIETHDRFHLFALDDALSQSDILAVLVNHSCFSQLKIEQVSSHVVLDFCGFFNQISQ